MWSCLCEFVSIECRQYRERLGHWDIFYGIMDEVKNCSILLLLLCAIFHMRNWSFNHCDPKPCGPVSNFKAIPVSKASLTCILWQSCTSCWSSATFALYWQSYLP